MSEEEIIDKVMMIDQWKVSGDIYTQNELNAIGELLDLYNKEKEKNKKAIEMLQEHIKHCEQEAKGSLHNEICHISLEFDKSLLDIIKQVEGE